MIKCQKELGENDENVKRMKDNYKIRLIAKIKNTIPANAESEGGMPRLPPVLAK